MTIFNESLHLGETNDGQKTWSTLFLRVNIKKNLNQMFTIHKSDCIKRVKIHPNGNYVGTVSTDGSLRLWDVLDGICTRVYNFGSIIPTILSFSLNGIYVVVGAFDGSIYLWNLSSPVIAAILKSHSSLICGLSFDRNSNILTSCSSDDCIHTWSINEITKMKFNEYNSTSTHLIHKASTKGVNMNSLTYTHRNIVMITGFND
ncbi:hypothetical protein A3Q56_03965 [Intoshia linei]|uniref:Uncharacterized protein n=1 Tax=Intoshia linei TaxID=1819745 RepID=A0A177B4E8_9BILA|nr:hypothetical protein A3Q56_03965 [Intoshia linei]